MEEKILFQISDPYGDKAFPIDWNKLPEDLINEATEDKLYNNLAYSEENKLSYKTVLYFREVKKFKKNIKEFKSEDSNVIFGL